MADTSALTRAHLEEAARELDCEWEAIAAVAKVETGGDGAYGADGRPVIRWERHYFSRYSHHRFDQSHPHLCGENSGSNPREQPARWAWLAEAYALDPEAALKSCSWGRFQLMGDNFAQMGKANAHDYVAQLARSQADQLKGFIAFVKAKGLVPALKEKRWADFAYGYNGSNYTRYHYDQQMEEAYNRYKRTQTF